MAAQKTTKKKTKTSATKPARNTPSRNSKAKVAKDDRDIEKAYSTKQFVSKLRRLADALETGKRFQIQVAGERIAVPSEAFFNIEHEREDGEEEVEFQIKWKAA